MSIAFPCKGAREILPPRGRVSNGTQTVSPLPNDRVTWMEILHPWNKPTKDSHNDCAMTSENAALTSHPKPTDVRLCNEARVPDCVTSLLSPLSSSSSTTKTSNTQVKFSAMATHFADRYRLNSAVSTTRQAAHDSSEAIRQVAEEHYKSHSDERRLEKGQTFRVIPRMGTRAYHRRQCLDTSGRIGGGNVEMQRVGTFLFHRSLDGKEQDPEEVDTSTSSAYNTGSTTPATSCDSSGLENRLEVSLEISSRKRFEATESRTIFDESLLERGLAKRHVTPNAGVKGRDILGLDAPTPGKFPDSKTSARKVSEFSLGSESDRFSSNQKRHRCHVTGTATRDWPAEVTCFDVMYTNRANLKQTMLIQQSLMYDQQQQQQLRRAIFPERLGASSQTHRVEKGRIQSGRTTAGNIKGKDTDTVTEWMVRKRSDGRRYIAKRPRSDFKVTRLLKKIPPSRGIIVSSTSSDDDDVDSDVKPRRLCRRENAEVTRSRQKKNDEILSRRRCALRDGVHSNAFDATNATTQKSHVSANDNSMLGRCLDSGQRCNKDNVDGNGNRALLFVATF